ncbi:MAG TPA: hypothetical protein VGG64_02205 [Pirellulales bacterium]|jgi:hypothetical protein
MATAPNPKKAAKAPRRPTTSWQRFWWRYSPRFELPISTVISISLHVFVVLLFALGLTAFAKRNHRPPTIGAIAIVDGDGDGAAPGIGADGLPSGAGSGTGGDSGQSLEQSTSTSSDMPLPTTPSAQLDTEVQPDAPVDTDFSPSETSVSAGDVAQRAESAANSIRKRLAQNLNKSGGGGGAGAGGGSGGGTGGDGSGGGGQGGGGGDAASGRSARQARWILRFNMRSAADYVAQIKGLGATIVFPGDGGSYVYVDLSKEPPGQSIHKEGEIDQMFWMDQDPSSARRVAEHLHMSARGDYFMTLLPQRLEDRLSKLEIAYRGLSEDRIKSTQFEVVRTGGGFDVQVVAQEPR